MTLLYAIAVAAIMAAGIYLMLDRNVIRIVLGTALIATGVNLVLFWPDGWAPPTRPSSVRAAIRSARARRTRCRRRWF